MDMAALRLNNDKRNLGIDALRIVSMLMILCMHILEHGGIINNLKPLSINYVVFWGLEILTYCGVNCYALVSGYVNCFSKGYRFSRIISLWLQVVFYGIIITAIICAINPSLFEAKQIIGAIFPVVTGQYWYFTAYFCLFFFMPGLNIIINSISKKQLQVMIIAIIVLFSLIPTISNKDPFIVKSGFSTTWLACCYLIGGYIRKYGIKKRIFKHKLLVFLLCILATYGSKMGIEFISSALNMYHSGNLLVNYTSPTILLGAITLLAYFSEKEVNRGGQHFIEFAASSSFGVYLIHEQPLFRDIVVKDRFLYLLDINPIVSVLMIVIIAIIAYILFSCIDWLRARLFVALKGKNFFMRFDILE